MTSYIRFKKCDKIYKELEAKHCKIVYDNSNTFTYHGWTSSAREIEADLYSNYLLKGEINSTEKYYIFGRICQSALSFSKGDFWRV